MNPQIPNDERKKIMTTDETSGSSAKTTTSNSFTEIFKIQSAFIIVVAGLGIFALLAYFLPVKDGWKASEVNSLVGTLTTFLGTAIGAFLGVQVGAAGKEKSDNIARDALSQLPADKAAEVLGRTR